jgi:hypothetical protein
LWRKYYREARPNHGGGARGPQAAHDRLTRVKTAINNITGLDGEADEIKTEICRLIDDLLASIQPATEAN